MFAKALLLFGLVCSCQCVDFIIKNKDRRPIWIGILSNPGKPILSNGGFILEARSKTLIAAPDDWAGRFWGRTWCDWSNFYCETGDCGRKVECAGNGGTPPATLVEITLRGFRNIDFYDVSLVDGFNLKASIEPINGTTMDKSKGCQKAACDHQMNDDCPEELRLVGNLSWVIGCQSPCWVFNTDEHCCRGIYQEPVKCRASAFANYFKNRCPNAYSYAYDDASNAFSCTADSYRIIFG